MHFEERTIKVIVDESKCVGCKTHACAVGCKLYDRGILVIKDGKPTLGGDADYAQRVGTECLACEYECWFRGNKAIKIEAPIPGLEEYLKKRGLSLS
jgi:Pyruvate/2-oxoacid:ferredoxin oxidoreductase delta subunit